MQFKTEKEANDYQVVAQHVEHTCKLNGQTTSANGHITAKVELDKPYEESAFSATTAINKLIEKVWNTKEAKAFILKQREAT